jgi:hypothetical protein
MEGREEMSDERTLWRTSSMEGKWKDGKGDVRLAHIEYYGKHWLDLRILNVHEGRNQHTRHGVRLTIQQLEDAINLYAEKAGIDDWSRKFIQPIQGFRLDRTSVTPEQAEQTFSLESIEKLADTFALWVLAQTYWKWSVTNFSPDTAPETVKIRAYINWSDDE